MVTHDSSPVSLLLIYLTTFTLVLTSPLNIQRSESHTKYQRRADYYVGIPNLSLKPSTKHLIKSLNCPGQLPQDVSDYPSGINMKPSHILDDGLIIAIEFMNGDFPVEVWDRDGLCDAAGCFCTGPTTNCNNVEGLNYNRVIAATYAEICFHTCDCLAVDPRILPVGNATDGIDVGRGGVFNLSTGYDEFTNHTGGPDAAVLGHAGCLAGAAAGWTYESSAAETCCGGYAFKALEPQEAHMLYGLPYISNVTTGSLIVGVCVQVIASQ